MLRKSPLLFRRTMSSLIHNPKTEQYMLAALNEKDVAKRPELQFEKWFKEAQEQNIAVPEALNLATAELPSGRVSNRTVLMKELDTNGNVVIYSNWGTSRKAADFKTNPYVSLTFWWKELQRQVRVEGKAHLLSKEESQPYFNERPKGSRIGAIASKQSQPIESREKLEETVAQVAKKYQDTEEIPCPEYWGGLVVEPDHWEFFQGRESRVHDRIVFDKQGSDWKVSRICP